MDLDYDCTATEPVPEATPDQFVSDLVPRNPEHRGAPQTQNPDMALIPIVYRY